MAKYSCLEPGRRGSAAIWQKKAICGDNLEGVGNGCRAEYSAAAEITECNIDAVIKYASFIIRIGIGASLST